MYERSAIVLERYFENLLGYRRECNLRDNYNYYCELIEKLEKYQLNYQKEYDATQEFSNAVKKVKTVQNAQNKLYKRIIKLEYNRNLLFNNVDAKVEEIKKCIEKVEKDIDDNNAAMLEIREALIESLIEYNEKRYELSKCKRYKKIAENAYNECVEKAKVNFEGITKEDVEIAQQFSDFENLDDIENTMDQNGINERIPFNAGVISNAARYGTDVAKKEVQSYLVIYDKMKSLLEDIENGTTQVEDYKHVLINEKAKMDFIYATKEYLFQFLDYERMTVIHGRKSHNRLMNEACENFNQDIVQVENLYELLLKELVNKATNKLYKELYNKSYLKDIQEKEEKFKKEKNKVNLNTATLLNSNYWRIDGIKAIYTVFYNNVTNVLGKQVEVFDVPKDLDEDEEDDVDDEVDNDYEEEEDEEEEVVATKPVKTPQKEVAKKKTSKVPFAIDATIEDIMAEVDINDDEDDEEIDLDDEEIEDVKVITRDVKKSSKSKVVKEDDEDDEDYDEDDDEEDDEEVIVKPKKPLKKKTVSKPIVEDDEEDDEDDDDVDEETEDDVDEEEDFEDIVDDGEIEDSEFDIFGDRYKNIDFSNNDFLPSKNEAIEDESDEEESIFEEKEDVDSIFEEEPQVTEVKKRGRKKKADDIEDLDLEYLRMTQEVFSETTKKRGRKKKNEDVW